MRGDYSVNKKIKGAQHIAVDRPLPFLPISFNHVDKEVVFFVRVEGLEPPRREALDPKSSMSTNFITPANKKTGVPFNSKVPIKH